MHFKGLPLQNKYIRNKCVWKLQCSNSIRAGFLTRHSISKRPSRSLGALHLFQQADWGGIKSTRNSSLFCSLQRFCHSEERAMLEGGGSNFARAGAELSVLTSNSKNTGSKQGERCLHSLCTGLAFPVLLQMLTGTLKKKKAFITG